jgi:hypothetical protein
LRCGDGVVEEWSGEARGDRRVSWWGLGSEGADDAWRGWKLLLFSVAVNILKAIRTFSS